MTNRSRASAVNLATENTEDTEAAASSTASVISVLSVALFLGACGASHRI
jgi:hypothetical protein